MNLYNRYLSLRFALAAMVVSGFGSHNAVAAPTERRIIFFGDSLTQEATGGRGFITLIREGLRAVGQSVGQSVEQSSVTIIGAGVRGDTVRDLAARVERDVISQKPEIVIILIGINDIVRLPRGLGTPIEPFIVELRRIVQALQTAGVTVILATPPVIGEDNHNQFSELLARYRARIIELTRETKCELVDLRADFLLFLSKKNFRSQSSGLLTRDGVHLSTAGNELVAQSLLPVIRRLLGVPAKQHASKTG